jgi:hypothetical protein
MVVYIYGEPLSSDDRTIGIIKRFLTKAFNRLLYFKNSFLYELLQASEEGLIPVK